MVSRILVPPPSNAPRPPAPADPAAALPQPATAGAPPAAPPALYTEAEMQAFGEKQFALGQAQVTPWATLVNWVKSKGGATHVAFLIVTAASTALASSPALRAHALVLWNMAPTWLHETGLLAAAAWAFYTNPNRQPAG